jgi:hypothetical protein
MKHSPAIVVIAFNRPRSLERLLFSLRNVKNIQNAKLVISIDNKEPENYVVRDLAEAFDWPYGEKTVIYQEKRLGLKKHVLKCGDLVNEYGSVILLEDDLFVSPYFYEYAVQALEFYDDDDQIGGISLYNPQHEEIRQIPFNTIYDDSDVYFYQFPSSLGQCWTKKQWQSFRNWYEPGPDISSINIHSFISSWPETSWKKYYCAYLIEKNKYFVYPRISLTTNFNDPGTHLNQLSNHDGQTPLKIFSSNFRLKKYEDSLAVYDSYSELQPKTVKVFCPSLRNFSFEMDLYGLKELERIDTPYILTSKPCRKPMFGFARALKPHELNILLNLEGKDFVFCETKDIMPRKVNTRERMSEFGYYHTSYIEGYKFLLLKYLTNFKLFKFLFR